ncbi:uncharacterized protein LOC116432232 isoform X2 [Nomia melanderi]|uniref:uncharacterized protein LOC116432232 isoform X2 n=1 Tax=Nomia melanderi TaxID=2448451 RepID=UPI003FCED450
MDENVGNIIFFVVYVLFSGDYTDSTLGPPSIGLESSCVLSITTKEEVANKLCPVSGVQYTTTYHGQETIVRTHTERQLQATPRGIPRESRLLTGGGP